MCATSTPQPCEPTVTLPRLSLAHPRSYAKHAPMLSTLVSNPIRLMRFLRPCRFALRTAAGASGRRAGRPGAVRGQLDRHAHAPGVLGVLGPGTLPKVDRMIVGLSWFCRRERATSWPSEAAVLLPQSVETINAFRLPWPQFWGPAAKGVRRKNVGSRNFIMFSLRWRARARRK